MLLLVGINIFLRPRDEFGRALALAGDRGFCFESGDLKINVGPQGNEGAQKALEALDRAAEAQRAKQQADADAMMEQLLAEDAEEKAKGAAKSAKSAKSAKGKKARQKRGGPAVTDVASGHALEARGTGVEDSGKPQAVLMPVALSRAAKPTAASPAALGPEPVAPLIEARAATAPVPAAIGASSRGRGGRGLGSRGGQRVQSAAAIATGDDEVGAAAHLLGQSGLQVPACSSDAGAAALLAAAAPVWLNRPLPPPPPAVTSLADAQFSTGRLEAPESTIGGQLTCIICFTNPKSHAAGPCGHQCACGDCSALMKECPVCRTPVQMWMHVRVA